MARKLQPLPNFTRLVVALERLAAATEQGLAYMKRATLVQEQVLKQMQAAKSHRISRTVAPRQQGKGET